MRRLMLAAVLTGGMIFGFASGFASLHHGHGGWQHSPCAHAPPATPAEPGR